MATSGASVGRGVSSIGWRRPVGTGIGAISLYAAADEAYVTAFPWTPLSSTEALQGRLPVLPPRRHGDDGGGGCKSCAARLQTKPARGTPFAWRSDRARPLRIAVGDASCAAPPCTCPSTAPFACVPLSGYLNSQFGALLPLALSAALSAAPWPQGFTADLGVLSPGASVNAAPLVLQLELGTASGGTYWYMSGCAAQVQLTATVLLPSLTMTLATPATVSLALTGTLTAWAQTDTDGTTHLTALTATNLGLAPNPLAGGAAAAAALNASDQASTSFAALLTALLTAPLATALLNDVLAAVAGSVLPLSLGAFSLCLPSTDARPPPAARGGGVSTLAPPPRARPTMAAAPILRRGTFTPRGGVAHSGLGATRGGAGVGGAGGTVGATAAYGEAGPIFTAVSGYLQSQLNGGLWATIATTVGFTLGGNATKLDPLNVSGVVSGSSGGGSCGSTCIAGTTSYGRGTGSCSCAGGWTNMGTYCYQWLPPNSENCYCGAGEENYGSLCYPTCQAGYAPVGCCICAQQVQMCAGGAAAFQMGNLTGLAGLQFATFDVEPAAEGYLLTCTATVSGTITVSGGSAWASGAVFEVPCGEADNWANYLPHEVSLDFPAVSAGVTATVVINLPYTSDGIANTTLQLSGAQLYVHDITVDPLDWASILSGVPGLSQLADAINGALSSALGGAVSSAIPTNVLSALPDTTLPFPMI